MSPSWILHLRLRNINKEDWCNTIATTAHIIDQFAGLCSEGTRYTDLLHVHNKPICKVDVI